KKLYFLRMVDIEILKLTSTVYDNTGNNVSHAQYAIEKFPLNKIKEVNPALEEQLREGAFSKAKVDGGYACARCGKIFENRQFLQVDHIIPINNAGLSVPDNLQILCRSCNAKKGDNIEGKA
ncbi:MAG: HNH endonuclease, partial [Selenomonadaceae bacterium]|nr:HNH endonuclease [Selenomonadaceae bacterium]